MKNIKFNKFKLVIPVLVGILMFTGCGKGEAKESPQEPVEKPMIAVSIVPEKTFVDAVCGDLADTVLLVPPGNSPANYEPTPQIMEDFNKADIYFAIGVPTEAANILPKVGEKTKVVSLQETVAEVYPDRAINGHDGAGDKVRDPHIWVSPKRVMVMVDKIAEEMSLLDPVNAEAYRENADKFIEELNLADKYAESGLKNLKNKKFFVFHPAFGYFADDYGLEMYALEQGGKEASPQVMAEMADLAKAENIKAIFYQAEIHSSQAQAFADEIGGKTVQLAPLSPNYIENIKTMTDLIVEVNN